jgi:hypothetical protein
MSDDIRQPPETQATPASEATSDRISMLIGMPVEEYLDADAEAHRPPPSDPYARRLFKALMLAPTLMLCEALLRNERVPWQQFDPRQAERFGLRRRTTDGRYALDDFNDIRRNE